MRQVTVSPYLACDPGLLKEEFARWLEKVSSKVQGGVTVVIDSADRLQVWWKFCFGNFTVNSLQSTEMMRVKTVIRRVCVQFVRAQNIIYQFNFRPFCFVLSVRTVCVCLCVRLASVPENTEMIASLLIYSTGIAQTFNSTSLHYF